MLQPPSLQSFKNWFNKPPSHPFLSCWCPSRRIGWRLSEVSSNLTYPMILCSEHHINKMFPSPQFHCQSEQREKGKTLQSIPVIFLVLLFHRKGNASSSGWVKWCFTNWYWVAKAAKLCAPAKEFGVRSRQEFRTKGGKRSRKTTVFPHFCSIKRVTIHVILLKQWHLPWLCLRTYSSCCLRKNCPKLFKVVFKVKF